MSRGRVAVVVGLTLAVLLGIATPAGAAPPTVAVAGDSIGDESRHAIRAAVEATHRITWYVTRDSATIGKLGPALVEAVAAAAGPDIVLVELGTGNAYWGTSPEQFRRQVRELTHTLLRHADCVRWFEQKPGGNIAYPGINVRARAFNRILRQEVDAVPGAHTVHYEAWTRLAGDGIFRADLLHLNPRGQRGLGRLAAQAVRGCDPALTTGPYWDVADAHPAAAAVRWVADQGLVDGFANDTFRLEVGGIAPTLSRLGLLRALWRQAGRPTVGGGTWPDVGRGARTSVAWGWAEGITGVAPGGRFRPSAPVTRGDALRWLYRSAGTPPVGSLPPHGLVDVGPTLDRAARWAVAQGIVRTPDGRFRPGDPLTRAQAVLFLFRAAHPPPPPPPTPAPAPSTTAPPTTSPPTTAPATTLPAATPPSTTLAPAPTTPPTPPTTAA